MTTISLYAIGLFRLLIKAGGGRTHNSFDKSSLFISLALFSLFNASLYINKSIQNKESVLLLCMMILISINLYSERLNLPDSFTHSVYSEPTDFQKGTYKQG